MTTLQGGSPVTETATGRRRRLDAAMSRWSPGRRDAVAASLLVAVALLPVVVVVVTRWARPYLPVGDVAIIDLRVRDVWSRDIPLVGPYSRFAWDHPGPAMYWLIAPLSLIAGRAAWATLVGAALLQGVAIGWIGRLAWLRGGLRWVAAWMCVIAVAYEAAYAGAGRQILLWAWNPYVAFPFFALLLLQLWVMSTGDLRGLAGTAFVASFLVQTHVGYLPFVGVLGAWALYRLYRARSADSPPFLKLKPVRRAAAVVGVMWFPVALECIVHFPGNLPYLIKNLTIGTGGQSLVGLRTGAGLVAREFRWMPPWLGGGDPVRIDNTAIASRVSWLVIPVILIGATAILARWRRSTWAVRLTELLGLTVIVGVISAARVGGSAYPWLFYWRRIIGAAVVVLCAWVISQSLRGKVRALATTVVSIGLAVGVLWSSIAVASSVAASPRDVVTDEALVRSFLTQLKLDNQPAGPILVRAVGGFGGLGAGIIDELDREGKRVTVDGGRPYAFGHDRIATPAAVSAVWYAVEDSAQLSLLSGRPGATILVRTHPLAPADDAELTALQRKVAAQLLAAGYPERIAWLSSIYAVLASDGAPGVNVAAAKRISQLSVQASRAPVCRCAVISFPPSQAP